MTAGPRSARTAVVLLAVIGSALVLSGVPSAGADEPVLERLTGHDPAHATGQDGSAPAAPVPVPLPDLGIAHRLGDGGINLFRMPLSELEDGFGEPQLVRRLPAAQGWRYDRSVVLAGDFGDITAGDDGTTDFVIWHALADGSVKVWAVGGGSDSAPRLMHTLPRRSGWNWADSRPMAADVTGDGWADLVVRHRAGGARSNVFVLTSDGTRLGPPVLWAREDVSRYGFDGNRYGLADLHHDGALDLMWVRPASTGGGFTVQYRWSGATSFGPVSGEFWPHGDDGWSYAASRQLAGDFTGDGLTDLLSIRDVTDFLGLWVDASDAPLEYWQDLSTGGWSYGRSRQYLADTDGDHLMDVISAHRSGTGGLLVWRHVSEGSSFADPERIANLPGQQGWNWSWSRRASPTRGALSSSAAPGTTEGSRADRSGGLGVVGGQSR